jgi:nucleoside-diphosphate-sugar epimerase
MRFTVLGSSGFIGSHVAALAARNGHEVECPSRDENLFGRSLGHVIYCIGLTADFRSRPHETVQAHVSKLQEILTGTQFESLVYLSSTRVYSRCPLENAVCESTPTAAVSQDSGDLYNLSKLLGEAVALGHGPHVKVARLSNVVGPDLASSNFLTSVIRESLHAGHVRLQTSLDSSKDYIHVKNVADLLLRLGPKGQSPVYNVASGQPLSHREMLSELTRLTGSTFDVADNAPVVRFPRIDIQRIEAEFDFSPLSVIDCLPEIVRAHQSESEKAA